MHRNLGIAPLTDTLDHSLVPEIEDQTPSREGLWVTDAEIIRRLGVSEKVGYAALRRLDATGAGFPPKSKVWGKRRWWPAVKDYFDAKYGLKSGLSSKGRADE